MNTSDKDVMQNLLDAGCSDDFVTRFFKSISNDEKLKMLSNWRKTLLESVHTEERKITCLDYLSHQIEKEILK